MLRKTAYGVDIPSDLVVVGYISGAYGLQGWVRIRPYSSEADALLHAKTWWLDKPDFRDVETLQSKEHGGDVVASIMGVVSREAAEALKGASVQISRSHFPPLSDSEFYWVDLIGLSVVNLEGVQLGIVSDLMDNGAHPILRVVASESAESEKQQEFLIPFVDHFVKEVNHAVKLIIVDWGRDY